jgi:PAS domain S-box-containing protein
MDGKRRPVKEYSAVSRNGCDTKDTDPVEATETPPSAALHVQAATLQRALESDAFVPFVLFDARAANLPVVYVNTAFEKLTGYARDEILGSNGKTLAGDVLDRQVLHQLDEAIASGAGCTVPIEGRRKGGVAIVEEVRFVPIHDRAGELTHYVRIQNNAAASQGRSTETLQQAQSAMRDRETAEIRTRTKTEFLARLSHELRTPLNAVIGFAELLAQQEPAFAPNQARYLEHIRDAGRHLLTLVDDVLDLQRVVERRLPLTPRPLELASFVSTETTLLLPLLAKQRLTLHNDIPTGLVIFADPRCLRQALLNLGSNAIKYNRPSGAVRWTASVVRPGFAVLMLSDTGNGMSGEQIPQLFQPFDRLGKGLGLLIARELVEHMGGQLHIKSRVGVGTQVLIELPLAEPHSLFGNLDQCSDEEARLRHAENLASQAGLKIGVQDNLMPTIRVLYVEDNRVNAMLFEAFLGVRPDIELRIAETGRQALEIVEGWTPDVLVLDANLPDTHGVLLLQQMRKLEALKATPAFMCSADALEEDVQLARASGFTDYWTKPVDFEKVLSDLRKLAPSTRSVANH